MQTPSPAKGKTCFTPRNVMRFLLGAMLGLALVMLVVFNAVLGWVASGPRSLSALTPAIESTLSNPGNYQVKIGDTQLIWDGWDNPLDISLKDVSVYTASGQQFSSFPSVSVGLDIFELFKGNILPASLTIQQPVISLYQTRDRAIQFGLSANKKKSPKPDEAQEKTIPFSVILGSLLEPPANSPLRKLRNVYIVEADVSIGSRRRGVFFTVKNTYLSLKKSRRGVWMDGKTRMRYGQKFADINSQFFMPAKGNSLSGEIAFSSITPSLLSKLFADNKLINGLRFPVKGRTGLTLNVDGVITKANIQLKAEPGIINHKSLPQPVQLEAAELKADYDHKSGNITLHHARVQLADETVLQGQFVLNTASGSLQSVRGQGSAQHLPADALGKYWPKHLAPNSRKWVTDNIRDGMYEQAQVEINLTAADFEAPDISKDSVNAQIEIEDASIHYLPEHPPITKVDGTMYIDGHSLLAYVDHGDVLKKAVVSEGTVHIPDLNSKNPIIEIGLNATAPADDVATFLALPRINQAENLNLHADKISGQMSGSAQISLPFNIENDDEILYSVTARLEDVTQNNVFSSFDVHKVNGILNIDNQHVQFVGGGTVNGANISRMFIGHEMHSENTYRTFLEAKALAPIESITRFGYPGAEYLQGQVGVDMAMMIGDHQRQAGIDLTFDKAAVNFSPIYYEKEKQVPLKLQLVTHVDPNGLTIPLLQADGSNLQATGIIHFESDEQTIANVTLSNLQYRKTDLKHVYYAPHKDATTLVLKGARMDATPWLSGKPKPANVQQEKAAQPAQDGMSFQNFPAIKLKLDVGGMQLGEKRELYAISGTLNCTKMLCSDANIEGKTLDQKPFQLKIMKNPKGVRQFSLRAQGAGDFLRALNIFNGMYGGDLSVTGQFTENPDGSLLTGRVDGTSYTVKDAPVLAKLLSLASFSGFFDTLSGKGIQFEKLRAPFTLQHDVITITDAKTYGDAMGMTIEGTITFPEQKMNLKGTVVPSYSINTVLKNVPLIGDALMGGEGKGMFAASYSIEGSAENPDVMVNPLSILTPGFLRGLFDVFDTPDKPVKKKSAAPKPAQP